MQKWVVLALLNMVCLSAQAEIFGGIDFPAGAISFADEVVDYDPLFGGGPTPDASNSEPSNSIGTPDAVIVAPCIGLPSACPFVSLGNGGQITLRFVDNVLTGSGDNTLDLVIFEVGFQVEDTFVEISSDGVSWTSVGMVAGATVGVDLDAFGFGPDDEFSFVRLTDDSTEGNNNGATVGADIDAVGAVSTREVVRVAVPIPPVYTVLMALLILVLGASVTRRQKGLKPNT